MTALPARRLAPNARWVWRLQHALFWLAILIGVLIASSETDLPGVLRLVPLAGLAISATIVPMLRWRSWRWDVQPDAIQIRHGVLRVRHTVVPMPRVQHVDTSSDVLEQAFNVANVIVHTAADSHKIPLLTARDAEEVRARIAALAHES